MKRITLSRRIETVVASAALVAAMALAEAGAALAAVDREEVSTVVVPVRGEKSIVISNARGDVRVIGERGRGDISIEITKVVRAKGAEQAARLFASMKVDVARGGAEINVNARYPEETDRERSIIGYIMQQYPSARCDLSLTVPAGLNVRTTTSSGDIEISALESAVEITSASGDAELRDIGGAVRVNLASGDAAIARAGADASVTTASGDIAMEEIKGNAVVRTAAGDIELRGIAGSVTAASSSGDVSAEDIGAVTYSGTNGSATFTGVRGGVTAALTSGDIEVHAAPVAAANYEIRSSSGEIILHFMRKLPGGFILKTRTTSGDISVDLPIQVSKVGRHDLAGVVRKGASVVVLETSSGDITVSESEE